MHLAGPVWDIIATVQNVIAMVMDASKLTSLIWLLAGGILYLVRFVEFYIDGLILAFISQVYSYFLQILKGTMFNENIIDAVMKNVYVFIGVIVFFRLAMVILKYIISPELVDDGKMGADKLIKRVIIGMIGIISIPTIFTFATDIQAAILEDQVIEKILLPKEMLEGSEQMRANAGDYLGTYVLAGFVSPATRAPASLRREYESAVSKGDLSVIDINDGAWLGMGYDVYNYSYFIVASTIALGYVAMLMLNYCLDLITRMLKLFLYQLIAPIAMIEYMINGSDDGVFKSWKNAVLGTYFLLFIRVLALWFVIFVMMLMAGGYSKYADGTLLNTNDFMLRALIVIALLGFMKDLPKLFSNIFGIDLEQQSSASGLMDSIKGGLTKMAGAGLAVGGAAVGGIVGAAKGGLGSLNALGAKKATNPRTAAALQKRADKLGTWKTTGMSSISGALGGMTKAAANSNAITGSMYGAYGAYKEVGDQAKAKNDKKLAERAQQKQEERENARDERERQRDYREKASRILEGKKVPGLNDSVDNITNHIANDEVDSKVSKGARDNLEKEIESMLSKDVSLNVVAKLVSQQMGDAFDIRPQDVERVVRDVHESGGTAKIQAEAIVSKIHDQALTSTKREVEVQVNQVVGHRANDVIEDATQIVHQDIKTNTSTINDATQTVHRDIVDNTSAIQDGTQTIHRTVEKSTETLHRDVINDIRTTSSISKKIDSMMEDSSE